LQIGQLIQQIVGGLIAGSVYSLAAIGFTMIYGILEFMNFAHGEVYMVGAYIGLFLFIYLFQPLGLGYFPTLVGVLISCALVGIIIERLVFRNLRTAPQLTPLIAAMGLSVFLVNGILLVFTPTPRVFKTPYLDKIISIGSVSFSVQRIIILAAAVILIAAVYVFIHKTLWGKAFRATAQDREAAGLMSINVNKIIVMTFAIGSALAGVAGTLVAPVLIVDPFMGHTITLKSFVIVILGGFGNVPGTIVAAFILGMAESLSTLFLPVKFVDSIAYIVLFIMLMFRPTGLFKEHIEENV
jgi:branched-chain amino acid transport system permease protein